eukprot:5341947-Amphidinium_carterae.1
MQVHPRRSLSSRSRQTRLTMLFVPINADCGGQYVPSTPPLPRSAHKGHQPEKQSAQLRAAFMILPIKLELPKGQSGETIAAGRQHE